MRVTVCTDESLGLLSLSWPLGAKDLRDALCRPRLSTLHLPLFLTSHSGWLCWSCHLTRRPLFCLLMLSGTLLSQAQSQLRQFLPTTYTGGCCWSACLPFPFSRKIEDVKSLCRGKKKKKGSGGRETFPVWAGKAVLSLGSFGLGALENPSENGLNMKTTVL